MKLLVLDNENKSIKVVLDAVVATNQPHFISTWADSSSNSFVEGSSNGVLNGTTDVVIVNSPAVDVRRIVKDIIIFNTDTAAITFTLKYSDGVNDRTITKVILGIGEYFTLEGVFTKEGIFKSGGFAEWGKIVGTLANQTDLQNALNTKANLAGDATQDFAGKTINAATMLQIAGNDVYEAGTYTATMTASTSGTITVDSGQNTLSYIKKFNGEVTVFGQIKVSSVSSPVGTLRISLPFAVVAGTPKRASVSLVFQSVNTANIADFLGFSTEGTSYLSVVLGNGTSLNFASAPEMKAGTFVTILVTYQT